jgi:endo-alpha-1,4-polygalactosaminidase (GH114 family)
MLIKKTGDYKKDFKKIKGYEVEGHYFDGTNSFVVWKKKFWRDKTSDAEQLKNKLKKLENIKRRRMEKNRVYLICDTCKGNHFEKIGSGYQLCTACRGVDSVASGEEPLLLTEDMLTERRLTTDTGHYD